MSQPSGDTTNSRGLIYRRVSDETQSGGSSQQTNLQRLAAVERLDMVADVEDDGESGDDLERPGLLKVMAILEKAHRQGRPIGWLLVDQSDRLSRADSFDTVELLARMRRLGVRKVATPSRVFDLYNAMDRTLLQIEADHKNSPYLKDLGRRVLGGMLDAAGAGFWTGQKPPLGYVLVKTPGEHGGRRRKSGRLRPDPVHAPVVLQLFEHAAAGMSTRDLAKWLAPRTGRPWSRQGVQRILEREIYTGTRVFGGRTRGRHARLADGVAVVMGPDDEAARGDAVRLQVAPALITPELFARVQTRLRTGKQRSQKKSLPVMPLSGLCRCGLCGSGMYSSRQGVYPYLRCSARDERGADACPGSVYNRADEALRRVLGTLSARLLEGDAVARLVALAGQAEDEAKAAHEAELKAAEKALAAIDARLAVARRRLAEDVPPDLLEDYQHNVRELKAQRAQAEATLAQLRTAEPAAEVTDAALLNRWLERCRAACAGQAQDDPTQQNALLKELIAEVRVWPPAVLKKGKQTIGRVEVTLPEWLSRVLSTTAGSGGQRTKSIVLVSE